jgi:hypothetical protein
VFEYDVTFAPTEAIWVKMRLVPARSIRNAVSLEDWSVQLRVIRLAEAGTAERLVGAAGTACVVALVVPENELPAVLNAATR